MKYKCIFNKDFVYVTLIIKGYGTDLFKFPSEVYSKFPKNSITGMADLEEVKKACLKIWADKNETISYKEALEKSEIITSSTVTSVYDEEIYEYNKFIKKIENVRYYENFKELMLNSITEAITLSSGGELTRELPSRAILESEAISVTIKKEDENTLSLIIETSSILPNFKPQTKYFIIKGPWN